VSGEHRDDRRARILTNVWRTLIQLFNVAVVVFVLAALNSRLETVIVCLAGILYANIRWVGIGISSSIQGLAFNIQAELTRLKAAINPEFYYEESEITEGLRVLENARSGNSFVLAGQSVVAIICLGRLLYVIAS